MQIHDLKIHGVKGVSSLSISPTKLNFITGPSGSGKSSVMGAIRYAITGKACSDHTNIHAATSYVEMELDRVGTVRRSIDSAGKSKVQLNGRTTTGKSIAQLYSDVLGVSMSGIDMLTSSELLAHSLGKDLADYLLNGGFLKNDMTYSRLLALNPVEAAAEAELGKILPKDPAVISLEDIENAYQYFRGIRPALKNSLSSEATLSAYSEAVPEKSSAAVQSEIVALQTKIAALNKAVKEYPVAVAAKRDYEKNLAETQAQFDKYTSVRAVTSTEETATASNLANARKLVNDTLAAIRVAEGEVKMLENSLKTLATSVCPLSTKLVCTTDKTPLREELEDARDLKLDMIASLQRKLVEYQKEQETAQSIRDALVKQKGEYQMRVSLAAQLENMKKMSVVIPEEPDRAKLALLTQQLEDTQKLYNSAVRYENALKHQAKAEEIRESLRIAELLTKELSPSGGVRKQVLSHSIGPLEDFCNANMKLALPKYSLHFNPDDNFAIVLRDKVLGKDLAYESVSTGEQMRIIFILMCMLNQLNGVRVLLLDNVNALDAATFRDFIKLIEAMADDFDHIFISGIDHGEFVDAVNASTISHQCIVCGASSAS